MLHLTLELESPLAVGAGRDRTGRAETLLHVPSSVVLGALAAALRQGGAAPDVLAAAFGERGLRASDLHPACGGDGAAALSGPAPLTLRTCKRAPGFRADGGHGAEDALVSTALFHLFGDPSGLDALGSCPVCGGPTRPFRGTVASGPDGPQRVPDPTTRVQTHVGMDRRRGGAAAGVLYSRTVVNEAQPDPDGPPGRLVPTRLTGTLDGPAPMLALLRGALAPGAGLALGAAVSRGLGRCRVVACGPAPVADPVADRLARFHEALPDRLREGGSLVPLALRTPALFVDAMLRPSASPDGPALLQAARDDEREAAEALATLEPVLRVGRPATFAAWNGRAGLPWPADGGLAAGSVLLFRAPDAGPTLHRALAHLEAAGAGLHRALGFGAVDVASPLHAGPRELSVPNAVPAS